MSAWICNDSTIEIIVNGLAHFGVNLADRRQKKVLHPFYSKDDYERAAQLLINQNYRSVNYRYCTKNKPRHFTRVLAEPILVDFSTPYSLYALYKCIGCYEYQACETPDYEKSDIHRSLLTLTSEITYRLFSAMGYTGIWDWDGEALKAVRTNTETTVTACFAEPPKF